MPTPLGHALVGAGLAAAVLPPQGRRRLAWVATAAAFACLPDLDFLPALAMGDLGFHRGPLHSLPIAAALGLLAMALLGRHRLREGFAVLLAVMSHGPLDALTTRTGGGVALLWPVFPDRWRLGWFQIPSLTLSGGWTEIFTAFATTVLVESLMFLPFAALAWHLHLLRPRGLAPHTAKT